MKKIILIISLLFLICSCSVNEQYDSDKLMITATIFPQYDFARQIAGELADINMLLPAGAESHTYEPTPKDIIQIENSDIFIYTGGESDSWIDSILSTINNPDLKIICLTKICPTLALEHSNNTHTIDEHVWTSPENAKIIAKHISECLIGIDPENSLVYENNFKNYEKKLSSLDEEFKGIVNNSKRNILVFGDRFPFRHLTEQYNIEYISAFPGCAEETEPDISTVIKMIEKVKSENIPYVFYTDFSNHKIADTICRETNAELLSLRSCHTVTKDELENNITYIDLMKENAQKIKEALN